MIVNLSQKEDNLHTIEFTIPESDNSADIKLWRNVYKAIVAGKEFEGSTLNYLVRSTGPVGKGIIFIARQHSGDTSVGLSITEEILDYIKKIGCVEEMTPRITKNENNTYHISWKIVAGESQILFEDDNITDFASWKNLYKSIKSGTEYQLNTKQYFIRCAQEDGKCIIYFGYNDGNCISVQTPVTEQIFYNIEEISHTQ